MKQSQAVFAAICAVLSSDSFETAVTLTSEQRKQVNIILIQGLMSGDIDLSNRESRDEAWVAKYVPGLVNNHMRKDIRLNGGVKYTAKNPGIRSGSGDAQLKEIRALKSTLSVTHPNYQDVVNAETTRLQELAAAKAPTIDVSKLPSALQAMFTK